MTQIRRKLLKAFHDFFHILLRGADCGLRERGHSTTLRRSALPARVTLARYLREAQAAVGLRGEVTVLLTTDEGIRGLNRRFRKKNKATDVLSFPVEGFHGGVAGDLAISVETAARLRSTGIGFRWNCGC